METTLQIYDKWQVENAGLYTADMNLQTLPDLYIFSFTEVIQALAKNE